MESINRLHRFLIVAIICCLCIATVGTVVGAGEYNIRAENAIETPEQTVAYGGNSITIDHIGVVDNDGTIVAAVTAPSDTHNVELRNADKQVVTVADEQDGTVSFDVREIGLDPGTYMLLLFDGNYERAVPVVVSGYDIDATVTEETANSEVTISTTVTPTASDGQPNSVEAVVWNENTRERLTLDGSGDSYDGTISVSDFNGSYEVYVTAVGDKPLYNGNNEILGISEATVGDTTGSDDGDDDSTYSGGGSDATDDNTDNTDTDETQNESTNETDDDSSVIQPTEPGNESTNETDTADQSDGQTDDETPLSPVVAIIALVAVALVAARRRQ